MRVIGLVAGLLLAGCATVQRPASAPLQLAITVDDLPVHSEAPRGETPASVADALIAALAAGGARDTHGFINGSWTERDATTVDILERWREAGLALANHGWSHRHLNEISVEEFEQEVARNEPLLKRLSAADWRWFRYPFLDEGETSQKRAAARKVLAQRGYRVAAVTMDFSDWLWPSAHARCVAKSDSSGIARLEERYLQAARESISFYRSLSQRVHGRDIPYVLLLHVSAMTARMMPRLLDLYKAEGFRFVSLAEAQRDPAYADQMDPALAAEPQGLEGRASAKGIPLPRRTDFAPVLEALCR